MARAVQRRGHMRRIVRLRSDGLPEITTVSASDLIVRDDVSLIAVLTTAWVACTALQLTQVIDARAPLGTLTLILIRKVWASGTAWVASTVLERGSVR